VLLVKELSTAKDTDEQTIISELESFFIPEAPESSDVALQPRVSEG
jgi:hypothetical protein